MTDIEAIKARHEAALARMADNNWPMSEGRQDVAALLAMVDQMRAALKPFAEYGKVFDRHVLGLQGKEHDSTPCATVTKWGGENQDIQIPVAHLYIGDLRNAARTLKGAPDGR